MKEKKRKNFFCLRAQLSTASPDQHEWPIMAIQQCSDSLPILGSWRVKAL